MFHIENIKLLLHPSIDEQANLNIINIPFQIKYTFHRSIIQAAFLLKNAKNKVKSGNGKKKELLIIMKRKKRVNKGSQSVTSKWKLQNLWWWASAIAKSRSRVELIISAFDPKSEVVYVVDCKDFQRAYCKITRVISVYQK